MTAPLFYGVSKCRSQQIWRICSEIWTKSAKQQPFMVASDFALLYLIRRSAARFQLLSNELPPTFRIGRPASGYMAAQILRSGGMTCRQMVLSANFSSLCRRRAGYVWKLFLKKIHVKSGVFLQKNWKNLGKMQNKLGKTTKVPQPFSTGLFLTVFFTRSIIKLSYIHEQNTKETRRDFKPPAVCPNGSGPGKRSC